jgi:hypothetical protein
MPLIPPQAEHVPLLRIWDCIALTGELRAGEKAHLLDCPRCHAALRACIRAKTFDEARRECGESEEGGGLKGNLRLNFSSGAASG